MCLFHEDNLSIVNISGNKQVFKTTLSLDITSSQDAENFIQGYFDYNNEAIKVSYSRYDVYPRYIIMYIYSHKISWDQFTRSSKVEF